MSMLHAQLPKTLWLAAVLALSETTAAQAQSAPAEPPAEPTPAAAPTETGTVENATPLPARVAATVAEGGPQGEPKPAKGELLPEAPPPSPAEKAEEPSLKFGAGVILWYYQPFLQGRKNNVDTFFARITADGRAGIWGLHLEPRFRDTTQRSFEDGPVFLQEGYISASPGPITVKVGKSYSRLGLFWDNSFYGNVQVYDGLKLAPDYGVSVEANHTLSDAFSVGWALQYYIVDGRTNVSLPARDIVSVPGARRRNAVVARVDPEWKFGPQRSLRVGLSGQAFQADLPGGDKAVLRAAIDAKLQLGPFALWGEGLLQRGRHVTDFPVAGSAATDTSPAVAGRASAHNYYALGGGEYTYGWVTARVNASYGRYADTKTSERFFVPALGIKPIPQLLLLTEFVYWKRVQDGKESFVDRSLNVTAHGFF